MPKCPHCRIWPIDEDKHNYCGWCGQCLLEWEAYVDPYPNFRRRQLPGLVNLFIKNKSRRPLKIKEINLRGRTGPVQPTWVSLPAVLDLPWKPLQPGEERSIPLDVEGLLDLDAEGEDAAILSIGWEWGTRPREIRLRALPAPEIRPPKGPFVVNDFSRRIRENEEIEISFAIELSKGVANVEGIEVAEQDVKVLTECPFELDWSKGATEVKLGLTRAWLSQKLDGLLEADILPQIELSLTLLSADFAGGKTDWRATIRMESEPFLDSGSFEEELLVYHGLTKSLHVPIRNADPDLEDGVNATNKPLRIETIEVDVQEPDHTWKKCSWLQLRTRLPREIAARKQLDLEFQTETDAPLGQHLLRFRTNANLPEVQRTFERRITVRQVESDDGWLAIDFGTTNTCVAQYPWLGRPVPVRLERGADDGHVSPTIIQYVDISDQRRSSRIGSQIEERGAPRSVAASSIRSLKSRFRNWTEGQEPVEFVRALTASDTKSIKLRTVIGDYFSELKRIVELEEAKSYRHLVVTRPVEMTMAQVNRYKELISDVFGKDASEIEVIEEPVAAAYYWIQTRTNQPSEKFVLAVIDIGGGTTDICLVDVEVATEGDEVIPRVRGARGLPFGGEVLTERLTELLVKECNKIWSAEKGEVIWDRGSMYRIENQRMLFRLAELKKIEYFESLLERGTGRPPRASFRVTLHTQTGRIEFESDDPDLKVTEQMRQELDQCLKDGLSQVLDLLDDLRRGTRRAEDPQEGPNFKYVLLVGKTTQAPLVQAMVRERYPGAEFPQLSAEELKTCVSLGACYYSRLAAKSRTVQARYGIAHFVKNELRFLEFVRRNTLVPEDGWVEVTKDVDRLPVERVDLFENAADDDQIAVHGRLRRELHQLAVLKPVELKLLGKRSPHVKCSVTLRLKFNSELQVVQWELSALPKGSKGSSGTVRYESVNASNA